jgi:aspartate/methionine/tyrosine aminotransferase
LYNFQTYPFEKLNNLLDDIVPNNKYQPLTLTIGEPQFETPKFIQDSLKEATSLLNKYPKTAGEEYLKEAQIGFIYKRFRVSVTKEEIIPTFGTREVLFNFPQFYLHGKINPTMAYTNPFYQIYEGSAIASGAKVIHIDLSKSNNFKPLLTPQELKSVDLVIINFPNNPTSANLSLEEMKRWVGLAIEYDFVLINDECYSEIYTDTPPPSLLQASIEYGNSDFKNILVLNSISKRSSAPGLRSGFIAGDKSILKEYLKYRTYVGTAIPLPLQKAAAYAWSDESHVQKARQQYKKNLELARVILGVGVPKSTFYIWLEVDDEIEFTQKLYKDYNLKVIPGSFLGRNGMGKGYVRLALVYDTQRTKEALKRVKNCIKDLS